MSDTRDTAICTRIGQGRTHEAVPRCYRIWADQAVVGGLHYMYVLAEHFNEQFAPFITASGMELRRFHRCCCTTSTVPCRLDYMIA